MSANNILFEDNFDDGDANGWQVTSGTWQIQNQKYGTKIGIQFTLAETQIGDYLWTNYEFEVDLTVIAGEDRNLFFRSNPERSIYGDRTWNWPTGYGLHITSGTTHLVKFLPTSSLYVASASFSFPTGTTHKMKMSALDRRIRIYGDNNLLIDYTDSSSDAFLSGRIALAASTGTAFPTEVWYDNVVVTQINAATPSPTPTPTTPSPTPSPTPSSTPTSTATPIPTAIPTPNPYPSLNVLDLKQYDIRWKDLIYDTATSWTSYPTIERWGCALTSASMILNYYGHNILPGTLNTWLKNQPDGYLSNGLINWIAITRYSKLFSSRTLPALEFKRLGNDSNILINELIHARPAILEVPNHFIVAKSQTPTSFGINDPAYSNRPTLLSYSDTFKSIRSFTPSRTDLSYILLTIDQIFSLTVLDPNGNVINANTYIDDPLIDDLNASNTSGNPIKVFEFAKPSKGEYTVEVQGNGNYTLTSYLYDKNGNLNKNVVNEDIENGEKDIFNATIGKKNIFEIKIDLTKIYDDLNSLHKRKLVNNFAYKQIKFSLNTVKSLIKLHRYDLVKKVLLLTKEQIQIFHPWAIKTEARDILIEDIDNLLKSF